MIQDNQWHSGICLQKPDGSYELFESLEEIEKTWKGKFPKKSIGYMEIKYNYNKGQPIIDFGDFKASIVDLEIEKL